MRTSKQVLQAVFAGVSLFGMANAMQPPPSDNTKQAPSADNTKTNQRDRATGAVTADQQKMNKPDRETARLIRDSVYKDKTLSTYAHNVKIVVQDGTVTLKGPVRTNEEKDTVFKKAEAIAGNGKVVNQLDVAPKQ
jgi:hyperosmotically inducible periplasmic protein